ncbi:MAG: GNAT family N-acetyltransferase [Actinomycetota bacterium]|nr:GNAT family N-acetyltransferase [Actinomycetota bacterium]
MQTATTEHEDFARAVAWERAAHEQIAQRVEPLRYGLACFDETLPLVYFANLLWVTAGAGEVGGAEIMADADRLLGGFEHRWVVVDREPLWQELDEEFAAAGWGVQTHLFMTHRRAPDRVPRLDAVREVGHDDLRTAEMRYMATQPWCTSMAPARQVFEHHLRLGRALGERCFAVYDGDEVCAYAKLRHRDGVAQVEDVVVLEEHRGAGLGRLVTTGALVAGLDLEPELVFIVADDEDWPKELYARLGFVPAGRTRMFHRLPPG